MGTLTENFAQLTELLLAEYRRARDQGTRGPERKILLDRVFKPLMPGALRCGTGVISDLKDRQAGPFDIVGCWEIFPPLGEAPACTYLADGAAFCVQSRNWAVDDLTQFAQEAARLRKLERKRPEPPFCAVVSFEPLAAAQVMDFMKSPAGQAIDAVLSIGAHAAIRNAQGWYGSPARVPFVTERSGPEALKAFVFCLLQAGQTFVGLPFGLSDYQHL